MIDGRLHPAQTTSSISAEEAAAIAAAIERFAQETAPVPAPAEDLDPWTRAAMLEGVSRQDHADVPHPWINT
jgi:hypothetical protein